jgi:PAS domain-containing protein
MASNIGAVAGPSNMQASNLAPNQASSRAPNSSSAATAASKLPTFDFTRRKRWAELLVHELAEAIALVLSPSGKIWFCSPAVSDLLGWRDEELIDGDIFDLVNGEQAHVKIKSNDAIMLNVIPP